MPYWIAVVPFLAAVGAIGAIVSVIRRRPRSAFVYGAVAAGAIFYAVVAYYAAGTG